MDPHDLPALFCRTRVASKKHGEAPAATVAWVVRWQGQVLPLQLPLPEELRRRDQICGIQIHLWKSYLHGVNYGVNERNYSIVRSFGLKTVVA